MCLGTIARIVDTWDEGGVPMASVQSDQGVEPTCLLYVPEARTGDSVLVHLGFAVDILDPDQAAEATGLRREMGL